jgi:hypothetical protein
MGRNTRGSAAEGPRLARRATSENRKIRKGSLLRMIQPSFSGSSRFAPAAIVFRRVEAVSRSSPSGSLSLSFDIASSPAFQAAVRKTTELRLQV